MSNEIDAILSNMDDDVSDNGSGMGTNSGLGYAANLNKANAKNVFARQDFVQDIYDYYYERDGKSFSGIDEAKDYFMEDRRWRNMNLVSIGRDLVDANNQSDQQGKRLARLQTTFDAMPNFYEDGGDGWKGFATNALAVVADPINLIGFGSGGVAARAAAAGVIAGGGRQVLQQSGMAAVRGTASREALKAGIFKGALYEGGVSGLAEGVLDVGIQARNTELGLQDGYSLKQGAVAVAGGTVIGGAMGGALGGLAAKVRNPFSDGMSQTDRGIQDGRNRVMDAEMDAANADNIALDEANANADTGETAQESFTRRIGETRAAVNQRTNLSRASAAEGERSANEQRTETGPYDTQDTDGVNAGQLTEDDTLDLAAQNVQSMDELARKAELDATTETDLNKRNALNERAVKLRRASEALHGKLERYLSPDEVTSTELVQEILQITDQSDLLIKIGNDPDAPQPTGNTGGGTARNLTGAEADADADVANNAGARPGDGGNLTGDEAGDFSDPQNFTGGDNRMGPNRPETALVPETGPELSQPDQEFKDRLEESKVIDTRLETDVASLNEELVGERQKFETDSPLIGEEPDITEILKAGDIAEVGEAADAMKVRLSGVAQQNGVDISGIPDMENSGGKVIVERLNAKRAELRSVQQARITELEAKIDQTELRRADNSRIRDTEKVDYEKAVVERDARLAQEELDREVTRTLEKQRKEAVVEQAAADARNPSLVFETLNSKSDTVEYLKSIGVSEEDMKPLTNLDARTNRPARQEAFVKIWNERMGQELMVQYATSRMGDNGPIDSFYNTDVLPDSTMTFFEAILVEQGFDPDLRAAALASHNKILDNPKDLNDKVLELHTSPEHINSPELFFEAAKERFGNAYAERLAVHLHDDIINAPIAKLDSYTYKQDGINATLPPRDMASPSGEPLYGMKVAGAERTLPSGNLSTEPNANRDGRVKEIEAVMSDAINKELMALKERARKTALLAGITEEQADAAATRIYYDKIDKMVADREGFLERNDAFLDGQMKTVASSILEMKSARDAYNKTRSDLPKKFNSNLTSEEVIVQELDSNGELVDLDKIRYTLTQSAKPTIEESALLNAHFKSLEALRETKRRYSSTAKYNVVMKNNNVLPIGQLIMEAENEILTLKSKKQTSIKIIAPKDRSSKDISVGFDAGLADFIGRSQNRKGDGTYEVKNKVQAILKGSNINGYEGKLFRRGQKLADNGRYEQRTATANAIDEMQASRIAAGTQQRVRDEIEAERNKPRVTELDFHIKKIDALNSKIYQVTKNRGSNKPIKYDGKIVTIEELTDLRNSAMSKARAEVVNSFDMGPSGSVLTGLKAERARLTSNTQKGMLGNQAEEYNKNRARNIMLSTWNQIRRELNDPKTSDDRVRLLQTMTRDLKRMGNVQKQNGKPYDEKLAERIATFATKKEAAGRRAEAAYKRDVEAGMYDYENSSYGEGADRFEPEDLGVADAYAEQLARRDMGEYKVDESATENMLFGDNLPPQLKDEVLQAANQKKVAEVARLDGLAEYTLLSARAHRGEISGDELVAAIGRLNQEIKRRAEAAPEEVTVAGRKHAIEVASTTKGVEVDINNDISYSRPEGSKIVTIKIDDVKLGEAIEKPDGGFSIMHPDGQRINFKKFGPLKKSLVQIFNRQIDGIQEKSGNTRFSVKENAKGIPHVQKDPSQTATYKTDPPIPVAKNVAAPDVNIKPEADANDPTTWSGLDFEDMPAGRKLAIQFLGDGPLVKRQVVRMDNEKSPQSIREMLGTSGDVPYVIGHVQSGGPKAASQETFFPMDPESIFIDQRGVEVVGLDVPEGKRGLSGNSQSRRKRENRASDLSKVQGNKLKIAEDDQAFFAEMGAELNTVNDLVLHIEKLETADWQGEIRSLKGLKKYATARSAAARILKANVPNGIKKPTTTTAKANETLRTMFDGYPQAEVQTAVDFIERVALLNGGVAPKMRAGDSPLFDVNTNEIQIDVASGSKTGEVRSTPMSMELVHEMGHWVYDNLLDEGDRQKFWSSMEKYYDDNGTLNFKDLERGLVDPKFISNSASNPQEFFANQFLGFAMQTDAVRVPGSALHQVFAKVSKIGADLLNWLLGRETFQIDSDLYQIFQKHMPQDVIDPETNLPTAQPSMFGHLEALGREHGNDGSITVGSGMMKPAEFAGKQMRVLDTRIRELHAAKRAYPTGLGDSMSLAIDLERIAKETYGEYGGAKGQPFHKKIPGAPESGKARIMALDETVSREPIIQAQYAIHTFLRKLRAEEADHKFSTMLGGMSTKDKAAQEAIISEMTGMGERNQQAMYERLLTDSKSAYEGLDEAIVDHLHRLSTDLQIALQGAVKEYTGMFQRTMPFTERKRIAIDEYTGAAYVETDSPKTGRYKKAARKLARQELALSQSVNEVVSKMSSSGIDWRTVSEKDIISAAQGRKKELITISEQRHELARAVSAEGAEDLGAKATAFNQLKASETHKSFDLPAILNRLENGSDTQRRLLEIFRSDRQDHKNHMLKIISETDLEDTHDLIIAGRHYGAELPDAPSAVSTEPMSGAVSQFTSSISVRGKDKSQQAMAQDLFTKMTRMIKGFEDPSVKIDDDIFMTAYDVAMIRNDPNALDADDIDMASPVGEAWDDARDAMRDMADNVIAINKLREKFPSELSGTMEQSAKYDAEIMKYRKPLFDYLYDFTYALQTGTDQRAIKGLDAAGVEQMKAKFARMTTIDFTTTDAFTVKGGSTEANASLRKMIDEAVQILDGILFQPQSSADRLMETRRMGTADLHRAERDKHAILGMVRGADGQALVHPSVASKYADAYLDTIGDRLDGSARDLTGAGPKADLKNRLKFNVSSDQNVRGVTSTPNGQYGDGVYLKSIKHVDKGFDVVEVKRAADEAASSSRLNSNQKKELDFSVNSTIWLREAIRDLNNKLDTSFDEKQLLERLLKMDRTHWGVIDDITNGRMKDQKVAPVFARVRAPLDLTSNTQYSLNGETDGTMRHFIMKLAEGRVLDAEGVQAAVDAFTAPMSGREMYQVFTNNSNGLLHKYGKSNNGPASRLAFNRMLKDMGYDGLHTDEGDVVFNPEMVKEANSFKPEDNLLHDGEGFGGDMKLTGQVVEEMMVQNGRLGNPTFVGVAREARRMGMPQAILDVTEKVFKKRSIQPEDVEKISKWSTVKNFFRENSSLFRQLGANWFGDQIQPMSGVGTFEKHDALLARRMSPIIRKLNALPDGGGAFKRWNRRNRGLAMGALDAGQPASHERIINALRRGRGAVQALGLAEREIAMDIANGFNDELNQMKALGIKVGDARKLGSDFYVPQVYDRENILSNPSRFREGLVEILKREQNRPDFDSQRMTEDELGKIADLMAHRLTKGFDPSTDEAIQQALGSPFAARVINIKPGDYDFMDEFLVQDLQGILAKYYDRTIRKRVLTEQFGVNGHGFNAYVETAQDGLDAGVQILNSRYSPTNAVTTESGMAMVDDLQIPSLRLTPDQSKTLVVKLKRLLDDPETNVNNKQTAINMIIEMGGPDAYNNVQFKKRVEAVVNAAVDFAGRKPSSTTVAKMRQMMDVLNKKPIDGGSGQEARYKVSRALKSFTSVSLLGFTTFTSLPDIALPLVRSGNMRAFAKTWAKYSTDPSYRAAAKNIGVGIDNLMHERMVQMAGDGNQKFANAFFNATLLTPWTNTMREVASLVGFESFKSEIDRAVRLASKGKRGSKSYATAVRYLERYGLTGDNAPHDFLADGSFRIDMLPKDEGIEMQVQMAMLRFTNEAIFTPNPNDVPMWAQTPWGSMMFQLKSFPLMMMKLQGYIVDEFKLGNVAPAFYMLTAGVGAGSLSVGVKDYVSLRGGDDERSAEFRKRKLTESRAGIAEILGVKEGDDLDAALGWYLDGLLAVGGMGLIGEMLYNTSAQLDNGKYGFVRTMSAAFGPQVGTAELAFNAAAGAGQVISNKINDEDKNDKIRNTLRDMFGRLPVVGRIAGGPTGRETFVDAVGGEAKKAGRPAKGKLGDSKFGGVEFGGAFDK